MTRLIMMLLQRFGLRGGMKKAADMGINPRQYMEIVKRGKIPRGELPRGATSPMPGRGPRGETSPMPRRAPQGEDLSYVIGRASGGARPGRISELQRRKRFDQSMGDYGRGAPGEALRHLPKGFEKLPKADLRALKRLREQSVEYMARAGMGMRKQAFKKHRAAMKKARALAQKARKAQSDARAHAEGIRLMDETYGAF